MKKVLIGLCLAAAIIVPTASSAQGLNTLSISQLQAIVASLQAQLNALIAQLNQIQQQENNSKPIVRPIENLKPRIATVGSKGGFEGELFLDSKVYVTGKNLSVFTHANVSGLYGDKVETFPLSSNDGQTAIFTIKSIPTGDYKLDLITANGTRTNSLPITVKNLSSSSNSSITVTSPNGGEVLTRGSTKKITWSIDGFACNDTPGSSLAAVCAAPEALVKVIGKAYEAKLGFMTIRGIRGEGLDWEVGQSMAGSIPDDANPLQIEVCTQWHNQNICDRSDFFTITNQEIPSRAATIKVTVLKGGIYCIKAPCEFALQGAQVTLYDKNKVLVGTKTVSSDGSATFSGLAPGAYTAYASASDYSKSNGLMIGLLTGQTAAYKIVLFVPPAPTSQLKASSELAAVLQSLQRVLGDFSTALGH